MPGYGEDGYITLNGIKNSEAKFNNRVRPKGWLTPTARHLLRTHLNALRLIQKILPVTDVCLEINKFAFMALEDPEIRKHKQNFKNGSLKGYSRVNDAVDAMQDGKCLLCGKPIEHHHHMLPRHQYGSDTFANIVGLCSDCHTKVHKDTTVKVKLDKLHGKRNKKYGALSVLNQIIPYLFRELKDLFPNHVEATTGYLTMLTRNEAKIEKNHDLDAYCIALQGLVKANNTVKPKHQVPETYEVVQFRRHARAIINNQRERTYKYEGKNVAKNRHKRTEQTSPSLKDWYDEQVNLHGKKTALFMRSKVQAIKSRRHYNSPDRIYPGAIFYYKGERYVLSGQLSNSSEYRACGQGDRNFPSAKCTVVKQNTGLVYI